VHDRDVILTCAVCCSVLQCVAVCCSVFCNVLQCVTVCCRDVHDRDVIHSYVSHHSERWGAGVEYHFQEI